MRTLLTFVITVNIVASLGGAFNLTGEYGTFSSPGYPAPYADNLNETWIISVPRGFMVALYFTSFELEDSADDVPCSNDYVEIDMGANIMERLCGNPRMFRDDAPRLYKTRYRSIGSIMVIRMVSDFSNKLIGTSAEEEPLTGFKAHFYREDINECLETPGDLQERCEHFCNNYPGGFYCSCRRGFKLHSDQRSCIGDCADVSLNDLSGSITSPGFPQSYPRLTDCNWKIKTNPGKRIELQFGMDFSIESHPTAPCPYDNLTICDSSGQVGSAFCGTTPPFNGSTIRSTTNWFNVRFRTDASAELNGFQFSYNSRGIECELPPPPSHGRLLYVDDDGVEQPTPQGSIPFSALIVFQCDEGFRLEGSGKIACLKDGSLSDKIPLCVPF